MSSQMNSLKWFYSTGLYRLNSYSSAVLRFTVPMESISAWCISISYWSLKSMNRWIPCYITVWCTTVTTILKPNVGCCLLSTVLTQWIDRYCSLTVLHGTSPYCRATNRRKAKIYISKQITQSPFHCSWWNLPCLKMRTLLISTSATTYTVISLAVQILGYMKKRLSQVPCCKNTREWKINSEG